MPGGLADLLDVPGAHALLHVGGTLVGRRLLAEQVRLERLHPGDDEQHRRVVGDQRGRRHDRVPVLFEIISGSGAQSLPTPSAAILHIIEVRPRPSRDGQRLPVVHRQGRAWLVVLPTRIQVHALAHVVGEPARRPHAGHGGLLRPPRGPRGAPGGPGGRPASRQASRYGGARRHSGGGSLLNWMGGNGSGTGLRSPAAARTGPPRPPGARRSREPGRPGPRRWRAGTRRSRPRPPSTARTPAGSSPASGLASRAASLAGLRSPLSWAPWGWRRWRWLGTAWPSRRSETACRTPYTSAAARPAGPVATARPSPASADTWAPSWDMPVFSSSMPSATVLVASSCSCARSTAAWARSNTLSLRVLRSATRPASLGQHPGQPDQDVDGRADQHGEEEGGDQRGHISPVDHAFFLNSFVRTAGGCASWPTSIAGKFRLTCEGWRGSSRRVVGHPGLVAVPRGFVVNPLGYRIRSITLRHDSFVEVVRVLVLLAVPEVLRPGVVGVPQVRGHRPDQPGPHVGRGLADGLDDRVGLRRQGQVDHGLGQVDPGLGQPDDLDRLGRGDSDRQRGRVGHADVLAGVHDEPPGDEPGSSPASIIRAR